MTKTLLSVVIAIYLLNVELMAEIFRADSLEHTGSNVSVSDTSHVPDSLFTFAGVPRITIDGSIPLQVTKLRLIPSAITVAALAATLVSVHTSQQHAWWSGQRQAFHFTEDWGSALQVDKFGHAFGAYSMSYVFSEVYLVSGFNVDDADFYGSITGGLYQTYVETEDGHARDWGFSPSDWYFDALGATYFLAQHYIPFLQNFTPKWQYVPSEWVGKPIISRQRTFVDDYNSSTFWLSVNMHNLLDGKAKELWPAWLNLAVGYGGDKIDFTPDPTGPPDQLSQRRYIVGLDVCFDQIIPKNGAVSNWWLQTFRYIKFPGPAIEFSPGRTKVYLLYPFRLNLGFAIL